MGAQLAGFVAISIVVIVTPGPDTALTIRNALIGGRRGGAATAGGVATGQAVWSLAAAAGVAALLSASVPAFEAVRVVGALYLVYLGVSSLAAAIRGTRHDVLSRRPPIAVGRASYRQGVLSDLGNPKMAVFFTSLLPQFASSGSFFPLLALGLLFCLMTFVWLVLYAVVVARAGDVLRRSGIRRALDAVMGAILVAFGVRLATER
jgi:threonine/homoserine/homoserine lactone efflux protein